MVKRRIIVTGGMGFIGSALIRKALESNYEVLNIDSLTYASTETTLKQYENNANYSFSRIDIRDYDNLEKTLIKFDPDFIMHFAAESHVDRSIESPIDFIETNIMGTYNLLDIAHKNWINKNKPVNFRFHHISTDEVYGSLEDQGYFNEDSRYKPNSPYSASKASSDHLVRAWNKTYQLPTIITNCSNNYGPYQFPEKLIPLTIINAIKGKKISIYGTGKNIRDWLFVDDHADALLKVIENCSPGSSYNIGGENELTNIDMVTLICNLLDKYLPKDYPHEELIEFVDDRPGHDYRYAIDPSKIKNEIDWSPASSIDDGLKKTVKWYIENQQWWQPLLKAKE